MIDTSKYDGHPPAPWGWRHKIAMWKLTANGDKEWIDVQVNEDTDPTVMALIADAPLLLEAYKRMSKLEDVVREAFSEDSKYASGEYMNIMGRILGVIE